MAGTSSSTASFISYDLRPAKQSERRIILELLQTAGDCGIPVSSYRYVGMGANRFYDFLLIHKYLGISGMVSLEHDPKMYKRAEYNCPYDFIDIQNKGSSDFLSTDNFEDGSVVWFDYDGGIGPNITQDIADLGTKLKLNDFCFVTVYAGPPRLIEKFNDQESYEWITDTFGILAGDVKIEDVQKSNFSLAVHKIVMAAFQNAFSTRRDGQFFPFLQIEYSDSVKMLTIGGSLLATGQKSDIRKKIQDRMPFLMGKEPKKYKIRSLNLTDKERFLFDRASTKNDRRCSERRQLKSFGFKDSEITAYGDILRYMPRYVETIF